MQEMNIFEVLDEYNSGHFGNQPVEIRNICWVRMPDEKGLHEFPVRVVKPSPEEVENEIERIDNEILDIICCEDEDEQEFEAFELKKRIDLIREFGGSSELITKISLFYRFRSSLLNNFLQR